MAQKHFRLSAVTLALVCSSSAFAAPPLAPWLTQIGLDSSILSAAKWGTGQILGVVDTGIVADNAMFAPGQVSRALSACSSVKAGGCPNGYVDDNGHGTAVAAIAAAQGTMPFTYSYRDYTTLAGSQLGVAPNANIVAQKALNANGSGYMYDASVGIRQAVDAGAGVVNLSLGSQVVWGPNMIAAINYAASKGAYVVFAGGNQTALFANGDTTPGLTNAAIHHLLLAGSVGSNNLISWFSNAPGYGKLVDTAGNQTLYSDRWVMAPGENIIAPYAVYSNNALALWSGTSMSAPLVSGSLLLLLNAWPILKTNGTAADLLLLTAGKNGESIQVGRGQINLNTAFKPYGGLWVTQANGRNIAVSALSPSLITGGALGWLPSITSKLSEWTVFDGFSRNYTANLTGLVSRVPTSPQLNPLPTNSNPGVRTMKLQDGAQLMLVDSDPTAQDAFSQAYTNLPSSSGDGVRPFYALISTADGNTMGMGYGFGSDSPYAAALYGMDNNLVNVASNLTQANLANLAQGGLMAVYGRELNADTRVAAAFSTTRMSLSSTTLPESEWMQADANNFTIGLSHKFNPHVTGGITYGLLREAHSLLGSTYANSAPLGLGADNKTTHIGASLGVNFTQDTSLLAELGYASVASNSGSGLVSATSGIHARSMGLALSSKNLFTDHDQLAIAYSEPLRVIAGSASLSVPVVSPVTGLTSYVDQRVSLKPNGHEQTIKMSYSLPAGQHDNISLQLQAGYRRDFMNILGEDEKSVGLSGKMNF